MRRLRRKGTVHAVDVGTTYTLNSEGKLSEDLWLIECSCGWKSSSGFLHTAQKTVREHLGLPADWDSKDVEIIGQVKEDE